MNRLSVAGEDAWHLPRHAHVVVYAGDRPLLTIYRCGAAQEPPIAQLRGALGRVEAAHDRITQPTGSIVKLRESATLQEVRDGHFTVRP
ncbi:MAG: hypothetical protein ABEH64_04615 [Salinirussus sp.]